MHFDSVLYYQITSTQDKFAELTSKTVCVYISRMNTAYNNDIHAYMYTTHDTIIIHLDIFSKACTGSYQWGKGPGVSGRPFLVYRLCSNTIIPVLSLWRKADIQNTCIKVYKPVLVFEEISKFIYMIYTKLINLFGDIYISPAYTYYMVIITCKIHHIKEYVSGLTNLVHKKEGYLIKV